MKMVFLVGLLVALVASFAANAAQVSQVNDSITTYEATIACANIWANQGFAPDSPKAQALQNALKKNTSSATPMVMLMSYFAFDTIENAEAAVFYCSKTENETLVLFSNIAKLATRLKSLSGGSQNVLPTPEQLRDQVGNLSDQEAGETANAIVSGSCKSPEINGGICAPFRTAAQNPELTMAQQGCLLKRELNPALPACR